VKRGHQSGHPLVARRRPSVRDEHHVPPVASAAPTCRRIGSMPREPIEVPPAVARRFVEDIRAFHAEPNAIKADEIAARQLHALKQHYTGKLGLSDVKEMFEQMKDHG
jgi:hypothetical protein